MLESQNIADQDKIPAHVGSSGPSPSLPRITHLPDSVPQASSAWQFNFKKVRSTSYLVLFFLTRRTVLPAPTIPRSLGLCVVAGTQAKGKRTRGYWELPGAVLEARGRQEAECCDQRVYCRQLPSGGRRYIGRSLGLYIVAYLLH